MNRLCKREWRGVAGAYLLLVLGSTPACGGDFELESRLRLTSGYDDNIFEEAREPTADEVVGFSFYLRAKSMRSDRRSLRLDYRGGYRKYLSCSAETRFVHEIEGRGKARLGSRGAVGVSSTVRFKHFPASSRDSWRGLGEIWLQWIFFGEISGKLYYGPSFLDYSTYEFFDYVDYEWGISFCTRISPRLQIGIGSSFNRITYQRSALDYEEFVPEGLTEKAEEQIDHLYGIALFFEYYRGFFLRCDYSFEKDRSNSFGYSYRRHYVHLVLARDFVYQSLIKVYSAVQFKSYLEPVEQLLLLNLDTEGEQDNLFVVELSRGVSSRWSAFVRFRWTKNESLVRDRLYEKRFTSIGMEYQF